MIIWGSSGITSTKAKGETHCPACAGAMPYQHKKVRRFFTLYFIPLIPLETVSEYVECQSCKGTFHMDILGYDPEEEKQAIQAEFHRGVKGVMVRMMLADGVIDDEEVQTVCRIYGDLTGTQIYAAGVHEEASKVREGNVDMGAFLAAIAGMINDHGKEMIVKAAYLIAAADSEIQEEEKDMLGQVAAALGMTSAHFNGVIDSIKN